MNSSHMDGEFPALGAGSGSSAHLPLSDMERSSARKARKEAEKQKKQAKRYEEQLKKIRGPKSQKIQMIDESFLEKYHTAQALPPGPTLKTKKRSKKTPSDVVQINLSDCIRDRLSLVDKGEIGSGGELKALVKPVVPPIAIIQPAIVLHKGKQRETPKEKKLSKLKKEIINNRKSKQDGQQQPVDGETEDITPGSTTRPEVTEGGVILNGNHAEGMPPAVGGVSPFLKAIERCCSTEEMVVPPAIGSEEYQNGFPALNDTTVKVSEEKSLHCRAFRTYCDHLITDELRDLAENVVTKLFQFQSNAYGKNPIKAVSNKRYCVGFNEVLKHLETRKIKLVLIAPDLEPNDSIDQLVERVKTICRQARVPYVFAIKRRKMGFHLMKKVPVSCLGIISYDGVDNPVKRMLEITDHERVSYRNVSAGK